MSETTQSQGHLAARILDLFGMFFRKLDALGEVLGHAVQLPLILIVRLSLFIQRSRRDLCRT